MNAIPADLRPASEVVKDAADMVMLRWQDGSLGSTDANDAALLGHLNTLDFIAEQMAEIEADIRARRRLATVPAAAAVRHVSGGSEPFYGKRARRYWRALLRSFVSHA